MDRIGDRIRLRRQQLGIPVRELAQRVGVSHGTVSKWENNQTKGVPDHHLKKLAKVLDCNILWLIGLGFDLSGKWWSIECLGRTLIIYRGRVLLFSSK